MKSGKITSCATAGCGWHCCSFKQGNYIVAFPQELEGKNTDHLEVIDEDYHGGKKVVCKAQDAASCDGGYKPIDCRMYPVFPKPDSGFIHGSKCPLDLSVKRGHVARSTDLLDEYREKHKDVDVDRFLGKVEMVGYEDL